MRPIGQWIPPIKLRDLRSRNVNLNEPVFLIGIVKYVEKDNDNRTWIKMYTTQNISSRDIDYVSNCIWNVSRGLRIPLSKIFPAFDSRLTATEAAFEAAFESVYSAAINSISIPYGVMPKAEIGSKENGVVTIVRNFPEKHVVKYYDSPLKAIEYEFQMVNEPRLKTLLVEAKLRSSL